MENTSAEVVQLILSPQADAVIKLLQSCVTRSPIIAETEWQTIVNALRLDSESDMIKAVIAKIQEVRSQHGYVASTGTEEAGI